MTATPESPGRGVSFEGLIGLTEEELGRHFGDPIARRSAGGETWLVFRSTGLSLRVRCAEGPPARAASWTATFVTGHSRLSDAARALGLWPAIGPDQEAASCETPLIRRPLPSDVSGRVYSLTATIRLGLITALSVFDEPPDWT